MRSVAQGLPQGWAVQFESFPYTVQQLNPAATKTNYNLKLFFQHSKTMQTATCHASTAANRHCTALHHLELNATKYHPGSGRGSRVATEYETKWGTRMQTRETLRCPSILKDRVER